MTQPEQQVADRVLAGEAPPTVSSYFKPYPPGTLWMQVLERGADATHKTLGFVIWCTNMPRYVRAALTGPGLYDSSQWVAEVKPTAWATPPNVDPGGWQVPGKVNVPDMVLPNPNFYRIETLADGVRVHYDVQVGVPGEAQMGRMIDAEEALKHTPYGRAAEEARKVKDMTRPTPILGGTRRNRQRMPGRVPRR